MKKPARILPARILIVDDDPTVSASIELILTAGEFDRIDQVHSAEAAFAALELDDNTDSLPGYDVILLDIMMPEIDGIETCARIRSCERYRDTPILVVSGVWEEEMVNLAFLAGAHDYITKPINRIDLLARVHAALRLKRELDRRHAIEERLGLMLRRYEGLHRPGDPEAIHDASFRLAAAAHSGRRHGLLAIVLSADTPRERVQAVLESLDAPLAWTLTDCGEAGFLIIAPETGVEQMRQTADYLHNALAEQLAADSAPANADADTDAAVPPVSFACIEAAGPDVLAAPARLAAMIEQARARPSRFAWLRRAA